MSIKNYWIHRDTQHCRTDGPFVHVHDWIVTVEKQAYDTLLAKSLKLRDALKRAEGYLFMACQPDRGELFAEFDEENRKVIEAYDKETK